MSFDTHKIVSVGVAPEPGGWARFSLETEHLPQTRLLKLMSATVGGRFHPGASCFYLQVQRGQARLSSCACLQSSKLALKRVLLKTRPLAAARCQVVLREMRRADADCATVPA